MYNHQREGCVVRSPAEFKDCRSYDHLQRKPAALHRSECSDHARYSTGNCLCITSAIFVENLSGEEIELKCFKFFLDECVSELPDDIFCVLAHEEGPPNGVPGAKSKKVIGSLILAREISIDYPLFS